MLNVKKIFFFQTFTTNLKSRSNLGLTIEYVEFCPSGENFVLTGTKSVEIWSVQKAGIIKTIACEAKPTSVCWINDDNLLIGLNDGKLYWCDMDSDEVTENVIFVGKMLS